MHKPGGSPLLPFLFQLLQPALALFCLDGAGCLVDQPGEAPAAQPGIGWAVALRHGAWLHILRHVEAGGPAPDEFPLGSRDVVAQGGKLCRVRAEQLDGEVHRGGPVTPHEPPHQGMPLEAAHEMIPHAPEGKLRLPHIEDHAFVAEEVEVQALPVCGAVLHEQETLQGNRNRLIVHVPMRSMVPDLFYHPGNCIYDDLRFVYRDEVVGCFGDQEDSLRG
jgi:hypothetical protein